MKIKVLGAGSWGTALAITLFNNGHDVNLWSRQAEQVAALIAKRENAAYLPGIKIPDGIIISNNLADISEYEMVVLSVPSNAVREVCQKIKPYIRFETVIVNTAKGFELGTLERLSAVIQSELPCPVVVLSGPSHAEEVARQLTTTVVAAGKDMKYNCLVQDAFMNKFLRVYTNADLVGVEIGGAVKNIIAIGAGILEGLELGDNVQASLITRGLAEITRLGTAMGAELHTFSGLAGLGDLIVTCGSMHSRNHRAGIEIGRGISVEKVLHDMGMVVEGFYATESTYALAEKYHVDLPITIQMYRVLYEGLAPSVAIDNLMGRDKKNEIEII